MGRRRNFCKNFNLYKVYWFYTKIIIAVQIKLNKLKYWSYIKKWNNLVNETSEVKLFLIEYLYNSILYVKNSYAINLLLFKLNKIKVKVTKNNENV